MNSKTLKCVGCFLICFLVLFPGIVEAGATGMQMAKKQTQASLIEISIKGGLAKSRVEISGMAWYDNKHLVFLPQHSDWSRVNARNKGVGSLFLVAKNRLLDHCLGSNEKPIKARSMPFFYKGLRTRVKEMTNGAFFEGFEAIVFEGDTAYLTIETQKKGHMTGLLVAGKIEPDLSGLTIDPQTLVLIPSRIQIQNKSYESLFLAGKEIIALYELNGINANPHPYAQVFEAGESSQPFRRLGQIPFPNVEYRITDATDVDSENRFVALNYFYPEEFDELKLPSVPNGPVELLLEFEYDGKSIKRTSTPPIDLRGNSTPEPRNWEAVVRLDNLGFLVMTDKFPKTILGFAPLSSGEN